MRQIVFCVAVGLAAYPALSVGETISIPVTADHERVVIALWDGDVAISAGGGETLLIASDCESREREIVERDGGFRSLRSTVSLPEIVPGDAVVAIRTGEDSPRCNVTLTAPERLDLHARINFSGSITVNAWRGRLQAWSADGDVSVNNHSGSLSVTAMNGDASVSLADTGIDADSAITAANGTVTLTVNPTNVPALRAQARWGDIQTNLDVEFEEVVEAGGTWFATEREGAAPLLTVRNLNRDIVIRSSGP